MREYEFLEGFHLVLQRHKIRYSLVTAHNEHLLSSRRCDLPFIGIVDRLQADVLLVLEKTYPRSAQAAERTQGKFTIELGVVTMELQLRA